ncbi:hypothetical protein Tco_0970403 [Tanacetum coccineum]
MSQTDNDDFSQTSSDDDSIIPMEDASAMEMVQYLNILKNDVFGKAIPKDILRRFHGHGRCKRNLGSHTDWVWWYANSKKMTKKLFKQQIEAFTLSSSDGVEKGFDRFQQLLLTVRQANGVKVSTKDANHKFLRSLPRFGQIWQCNGTMRNQTSCLNDCYSNEDVLHERLEGEHTEEEVEKNLALMAISSNNEVSLCSKTCIDSYNKLKTLCDEQMNQLGEQEAKILAYTLAVKKLEAQIVTFQKQQLSLNEQLTFQANEIYAKDEKLKRYRRIGMKAVKEKEQLKKTVDSWKDSSKNLWKLIDSGMSSTSKVGLGYEIKSNNEVLSYEEEMNRSVFKCTEEDYINKPLYSRFTKTNSFKGVPHPLSGDYTPKPQKEIDDSLYVYGKKGPQKPEISESDDNSTEHSTYQSNDNEGSCGNTSEHSSESESESISVPNEMSTSKSVITNEKVVSELQEVEPSCAKHVKTPRQQMKNQGTSEVKGKN